MASQWQPAVLLIAIFLVGDQSPAWAEVTEHDVATVGATNIPPETHSVWGAGDQPKGRRLSQLIDGLPAVIGSQLGGVGIVANDQESGSSEMPGQTMESTFQTQDTASMDDSSEGSSQGQFSGTQSMEDVQKPAPSDSTGSKGARSEGLGSAGTGSEGGSEDTGSEDGSEGTILTDNGYILPVDNGQTAFTTELPDLGGIPVGEVVSTSISGTLSNAQGEDTNTSVLPW